MSFWAISLCFVCQLCVVGSQLFFKHAMKPAKAQSKGKQALLLFMGVFTQSIWFFLWLGLLEKWDLSKLNPFEGLNPAILAICAAIVLKERLPFIAWVGLGLICVGIGIVSVS